MEPATKNDLKDLMTELLKELKEDIKVSVAAAFGNRKPELEQATTPAASQLLSIVAPASPTTIVGIVPVLAASDANAKPLDIDATGVVPPTPTTCSTECPSRDATASPSVFILDTTPTSATATVDVTPVLAASVVTDDFATPSRLLQAAAPTLIHELKVLRPMPWPSFKYHSEAVCPEEPSSDSIEMNTGLLADGRDKQTNSVYDPLQETEERSFLKVLQRTRIPPNKVMKIFRRMRGSFGSIPFKKKYGINLLCAEQHRKENSDVGRTLVYFKEKELQNPGFLHMKQTDEDNIVRSVFWTDARSRMDYEIFGDFLLFDTTYTTDRHNMLFAPIIGINNHGRALWLGCALLHDENAETYKWMFETLLHVIGKKMPVSVMPQVRHRLCKWDVLEKAQQNISAFMAESGNIKADRDSLVDNSLTETEFEEGMNLLFKDSVLSIDRIEKFIERYEEMHKNIIQTDEEDRLQTGTVPSCFSLQLIEKHAANIYKRQIFLKVQRELLHSAASNVQEVQIGAVYRLNKVFNYENPEFDRNNFEVQIESGTDAFKCQCAKFTRDGILCCHIFRLFTQFGINQIPEQYIVPRWTDKFREEKEKQHKEKCLQQMDSTTRYTNFMAKMADLGKTICSDGAKYDAFMLEVDKIQENFAMAQNNS